MTHNVTLFQFNSIFIVLLFSSIIIIIIIWFELAAPQNMRRRSWRENLSSLTGEFWSFIFIFKESEINLRGKKIISLYFVLYNYSNEIDRQLLRYNKSTHN